ncbi:MAG: hypothetical protein AABZ29_09560 [Gemmatimonadota bacterium]
MTVLTTLKLSLALTGIILFGASIRFEAPALRWAGLACVAAAWLLRFRKPPASHP